MKLFWCALATPVILLLVFGACGLFAAIFNGILWLVATHSYVAIQIGIALWVAVSTVLRVLVEEL